MSGSDARALSRSLLDLCRMRKLTIATAESCTGGLVAGALTDIPGSSDVIDRGFVTYSNDAKHAMLGVAEATLARHGAVSRETAEAMARGALGHADADLAVAVQRITREAGVYTRDGHSDYGHAFVSFMDKWPNVLSPRSSLLVLGDGRNNYRNPEVELLTHMVSASRHAHWLNPEPKHLWGSGDSAVARYEDVITMHECRSAKQLASVIDQLLPV